MQSNLIWFNDGVFVCDTIGGKVNYHNYSYPQEIINHKQNIQLLEIAMQSIANPSFISLEGHASDTRFSWLTFSDLV